MATPTPELKEYVSEAQQLAAATYQCPVCQKEDSIMYADGSWKLRGRRGTQNTVILQYKCAHCGAILRRAVKGEAEAVKPVQLPTETQDIQPQPQAPDTC